MFEPPPLPPSWDGFHVLVVHFPVALLAVSPLFVLLGALTGKRSVMVCALLLMLLGVGGAFVATNTGEAAYEVIDFDDVMLVLDPDEEYLYDDVAIAHMEQSEFARNVFAGIAAVYAVVVLLALVKPSTAKLAPRLLIGLIVVAALGWGNLMLAHAAHLGGELVHRYGVRAPLEAPEEEMEEEAEDESAEDEEESPADEGEEATEAEDGDAGEDMASEQTDAQTEETDATETPPSE